MLSVEPALSSMPMMVVGHASDGSAQAGRTTDVAIRRAEGAVPAIVVQTDGPLTQIVLLTQEEANQLCKFSSFCFFEAMTSHPNLQVFATASRGVCGLVSVAHNSRTLSTLRPISMSQLSEALSEIKKSTSWLGRHASETSLPIETVAPAHGLEAHSKHASDDTFYIESDSMDRDPSDVAIENEGPFKGLSRSGSAGQSISLNSNQSLEVLTTITPPCLVLSGESLVSAGSLGKVVCGSPLTPHLLSCGFGILAANNLLRAALNLRAINTLTQQVDAVKKGDASDSVKSELIQQLQEDKHLKMFAACAAVGLSAALITTIHAPLCGLVLFAPFVTGSLVLNQVERQAEKPVCQRDTVTECEVDAETLSLAYEHLGRQIKTLASDFLARYENKTEAVLHSLANQFENHIKYSQFLLSHYQPALARDAAYIGAPIQKDPLSTLSKDVETMSQCLAALCQSTNYGGNKQFKADSVASLGMLHAFWQGQVDRKSAADFWIKSMREFHLSPRKLGAGANQLFDANKISIISRHPKNKKIISALYQTTYDYLAHLGRKHQHTRNTIGGILVAQSEYSASVRALSTLDASASVTNTEKHMPNPGLVRAQLTETDAQRLIAQLAFASA